MASIFEVGKAYSVFNLVVLKRTAKTVTVCGTWEEAEPVTKRVHISVDGVEFLKHCLPMGIWANEPYEDPKDREARIAREIAKKKEEARLARLKYEIPTIPIREVENVDQDVIVAWALGNNIPDLVKYADYIKCGFVAVCANPDYNHATKELYFPCGVKVWVYDGRNDKYTTHIFTRGFVAKRDDFDDSFKMECRYLPHIGETLTKDGIRKNADGSKWEPNWEAMNC